MADQQPSVADLQRSSIPSVVDGLTPDQRKIMFCLLKRKSHKKFKVSQLSAYVSKHTACHHHDEQRLATTIIRLTHSFVGSNNINLLHPGGQISTRYMGGKDRASPEHITTKLLPITSLIFPKDDDVLLDYLNEDGKSIDPTWDYKQFLESLAPDPKNDTGTFIEEWMMSASTEYVDFEVILSEENDNVQKYDTPEQIIEEFFKIALLENIELDLRKLEREVRFFCGIVHGDIVVSNRKGADLLVELQRKILILIRRN
ncbi:DNA topoisomerase 2 [Dichanthelium oligosanthes]|uniref:DNA topoisomerase (ATP-hydrolyzing) n=1 Tax=Dichanthelium oligosanthes TaxID=888268 RepID=A0A1E5VIS0_9POAL|nr:DNA topoisomerase 2 [Dichanthelium oligosanthes]